MNRILKTTVALPMLLGLWVVLAGADRGCFFVDPGCDGLDEQACLDDEDCQPVYLYPNRYEDVGCGSDATRCIGAEPLFDSCEAKPDCAGLDEQACVGENGCQAIYGYPEDYPVYGTNDEQPRCAPGARCIMPPETFIECLDSDADPCDGLDEQACWRRPMCEADYSYGGCEEDVCWDGITYEGCHLITGECTYDEECYNRPIEFDPGCPDYFFTCEAGQCVVNCPSTGCESDLDCGEGQRCEVRCGNGWCEGVCVDDFECQSDDDCPEGEQCIFDAYCGDEEYCGGGTCQPIETGCLDDADCAPGQICLLMPCDCDPTDPDCRENCLGSGICVDDPDECSSDADCPEGSHCQFDDWCEEGWCGQGTCVADHTGCQSDDECAPGERCEVYCGNGWCHGECTSSEPECTNDDQCAEGEFCQPLPNVDCWFFEDCPGTCEPGVWTFTLPIQCGGNAWEMDALENPERYYECMVDCDEGTDCGGTFTEICLVRNYFLFQGIALHDIRDVYTQGDVCGSCACPRGDTIFALVAPIDLERLLELGFSVL